MYMTLLALFLGSLAAILLAERMTDYILLFYYHRNFLSESRYEQLYDLFDDEFHFEMLRDSSPGAPKKYVDYLKLHQDMKPEAYEIFRSHLTGVARYTLGILAFVYLLPSVLFRGNWVFFALPIVFAHVFFILHKRLVKEYNVDFYATLIMLVILNKR